MHVFDGEENKVREQPSCAVWQLGAAASSAAGTWHAYIHIWGAPIHKTYRWRAQRTHYYTVTVVAGRLLRIVYIVIRVHRMSDATTSLIIRRRRRDTVTAEVSSIHYFAFSP